MFDTTRSTIGDEQNAERICRDVADAIPTPNVKRAVSYAEQGRLTWTQVANLLEQSIGNGLAAFRAGEWV